MGTGFVVASLSAGLELEAAPAAAEGVDIVTGSIRGIGVLRLRLRALEKQKCQVEEKLWC